ncbi:hypothetical protein MOQ72_43395 [Saccharopolyspora sp. K220]|uniref:hypothetical protein n=1 Tax=Saccharopolyspora soli TaxID=2926618 RepID=UPI001F5782CB|nr:hypothetical protein [Saccharopolyspora soli]MCI2424260.1 hypothetical protein [Saccharopolyspora soli]
MPGQVQHVWQEREQWLHRAGDAYDALAGRGQAVMGSAREDLRHGVREVGRRIRQVPGVAALQGEVAGLQSEEAELPIADYDSLRATQIVQKLPGLTQQGLHQVEGYEARNRARATILSRIDELRGQEPWPGYDEMTVDEILPRMRSMPPEEQVGLASYERRHKQRRTIVESAAES